MGRPDDADTAPATGIDAIIAGLAAEGVATAGRGGFSLDREAARAKMAAFQLGEPEGYVLELVRAAVLKGATHIRVDVDADDLRLRFDGRPFALADFEDLYNSLFGKAASDDVAARQQLAIGLNAATSLSPKRITVTSGQAPGCELIIEPGDPDVYRELGPRGARDDSGGAAETQIHVKRRLGRDALSRGLSSLTGTLPEAELVRERCLHVKPKLFLGGERISLGSRDERLGVVPVVGPGLRGDVGFVSDPEAPSVVRWVLHGVLVTTHTLDDLPTGGVAVVEASSLQRDLSGAEIVRDDEYDAAIADIERARLQSVAALLRHCAETAWVRRRLRRAATRFAREDDFAAGGDPLAQLLGLAEIWERVGPDGEPVAAVSLASLQGAPRADPLRAVVVSEPAHDDLARLPLPAEPVLRLTRAERQLLRDVLGLPIQTIAPVADRSPAPVGGEGRGETGQIARWLLVGIIVVVVGIVVAIIVACS